MTENNAEGLLAKRDELLGEVKALKPPQWFNAQSLEGQ